MASPVREVPHVTTYQPALFESSLPKWLACTNELAAGIQHPPEGPQTCLHRPNPSALVWAMVFDVDRPGGRWRRDAPAGCPSAQLGARTPERSCTSGLRAGLSGVGTLKARATPSTVLGSHSCGLTMALDADRAYTHRRPRPPTTSHLAHILGAPWPYELGELRDYLGDRLPLAYRTTGSGGEGEERPHVRCLRRVGHIGTVEYRIGTCGSVLVAPTLTP
jgi:hypothetical protein